MKFFKLDSKPEVGKHIFETGILIMIINLMTAIYIWQSISSGWKVVEGGENFPLALISQHMPDLHIMGNQRDAYIVFLRCVFSFLGNKEPLVLLSNFFLLFAGTAFFYRGSRRKIQSGGSLLIAILTGIMVFTWMSSGLGFGLICLLTDKIDACTNKKKGMAWILTFLEGAVFGCFLFFDLSSILLIMLGFIFILFPLQKNTAVNEKKVIKIITVTVGFSLTFCLLTYFVYYVNDSGLFNIYNWLNDRISFYDFQKNYLFLYQLAALSIIYAAYWILHIIYRQTYKIEISESVKNNCKNEKAEEITESIFVSEQKLPEAAKSKSTDKSKSGFENEEAVTVLKESKTELAEEEKKVKLLHNPLPVPKKHVKKVMNYAFEPGKDKMHYDLNNYNVNDDYDLK